MTLAAYIALPRAQDALEIVFLRQMGQMMREDHHRYGHQ